MPVNGTTLALTNDFTRYNKAAKSMTYPECCERAYCLSATVLNQRARYHLQGTWHGTIRPLLYACYVLCFLIQYLHMQKSPHYNKYNLKYIFLFLSFAYKVLTTSKPSYLNNPISVQPPCSTRSSSAVTLSRPPTIFSLKITDRSFRYASSHLWNKLPDSLRQPRQSCLDSPPHSLVSSSMSSPLIIHHSITQSSKHTLLIYPSHLNTSTHGLPSQSWDWTGLIMLLDLFLVHFSFIFLFVPCGGLTATC